MRSSEESWRVYLPEGHFVTTGRMGDDGLERHAVGYLNVSLPEDRPLVEFPAGQLESLSLALDRVSRAVDKGLTEGRWKYTESL